MKLAELNKAAKLAANVEDLRDKLDVAKQAVDTGSFSIGIGVDLNGDDITSLIKFESLKKLVVDSLNQVINERLLILKSMGVEINGTETSKGTEINVNQEQEAIAKPVDSWGGSLESYGFATTGNEDGA